MSDEARPLHLVMVGPVLPALAPVIEIIRGNRKEEIIITETAVEASQRIIAERLSAVVVLSARGEEDFAVCLQLCKNLLPSRAVINYKIMVVTTIENLKVKRVFTSMGVSEFLKDKTPARSLAFKVSFLLNQVQNLNAKTEDRVIRGGGRAAANEKTNVAGGVQVSNEIIGEDVWLIRGAAPRKIGVQWVMEAEGPDPDSGAWEQIDVAEDRQEQWAWRPDGAPKLGENALADGWVFRGNRPAFDAETGKWKFVSNKPHLTINDRGRKTASKVEFKDRDIILAADNPAAEAKIAASRKVGEAVRARRQRELAARAEAGDEAAIREVAEQQRTPRGRADASGRPAGDADGAAAERHGASARANGPATAEASDAEDRARARESAARADQAAGGRAAPGANVLTATAGTDATAATEATADPKASASDRATSATGHGANAAADRAATAAAAAKDAALASDRAAGVSRAAGPTATATLTPAERAAADRARAEAAAREALNARDAATPRDPRAGSDGDDDRPAADEGRPTDPVFRRTTGVVRGRPVNRALTRTSNTHFGNGSGVWEAVGADGWIYLTPEMKSNGADYILAVQPFWYLARAGEVERPRYDAHSRGWLIDANVRPTAAATFPDLPAPYQDFLIELAQNKRDVDRVRDDFENKLQDQHRATWQDYERFDDVDDAGAPVKKISHLKFLLTLSDLGASKRPREDVCDVIAEYLTKTFALTAAVVVEAGPSGRVTVVASTDPAAKRGHAYTFAHGPLVGADVPEEPQMFQISPAVNVYVRPLARGRSALVLTFPAAARGVVVAQANFLGQISRHLGQLLAPPRKTG